MPHSVSDVRMQTVFRHAALSKLMMQHPHSTPNYVNIHLTKGWATAWVTRWGESVLVDVFGVPCTITCSEDDGSMLLHPLSRVSQSWFAKLGWSAALAEAAAALCGGECEPMNITKLSVMMKRK